MTRSACHQGTRPHQHLYRPLRTQRDENTYPPEGSSVDTDMIRCRHLMMQAAATGVRTDATNETLGCEVKR